MFLASRLKLPRSDARFSGILVALLRAGSLVVLCTAPAFAQSQTTGRIIGAVKDETGGRIVGAQVTIRNNATAEEREVKTGDQGTFGVPLLSPGTYLVRITAPGFAPAVFEPVPVIITETTTTDAEMGLAGPDTVSIEIDSLIQRDGPQLGRVVDTRAASELPLATATSLNFINGVDANNLATNAAATIAVPHLTSFSI